MQPSGHDNSWIASVMPRILEILAGRLADIAAERQAMQRGGDASTSLLAIGGVAHKIAGTADSFGFSRLGELARDVEEGCLFPDGAAGEAEARLQLSSAEPEIDALVQEIARVLAQTRLP